VRVSRSRVLPGTPVELWDVVGDPALLHRWWPRVERVEHADDSSFTEVFRTKQGRTVRADYRIVRLVEDEEIAFEQELVGTPFERIFTASSRAIRLRAADGGTRVELELDQTTNGMAKLGALQVRRAMKRQLDDALKGLAALVG
jgi:uncharacterized protein YndB with AHSA1/START domain